jgi:uncharacterized protein (TIGR02466 family)
MPIHFWFPTAISVEENIIPIDDIKKYSDQILDLESIIQSGGKNWNTEISNSHGTYDMINDGKFEDLISVVTDKINIFAREYGSDFSYQKPESMWYNIYRKGDYQEYHTHTDSVFSAVFYVTSPENSGRIIFENPIEPDMKPVKNIIKNNDLNYKTCHYTPDKGTLIIFRSYLRHMVEKCLNTEPRITIAFNY